jgi:hypothetical protein
MLICHLYKFFVYIHIICLFIVFSLFSFYGVENVIYSLHVLSVLSVFFPMLWLVLFTSMTASFQEHFTCDEVQWKFYAFCTTSFIKSMVAKFFCFLLKCYSFSFCIHACNPSQIKVCFCFLHMYTQCSMKIYQEQFLFFSFLLEYICFTGVFIVTVPIRLILYTDYIAPILSPPQPSPCPT